ncbi:hypothetical protein DERP_011256 [Dermatophagoides pteronyssinus]|uniref:Uncharacterized protein n=1 Tax=Dermatophagoides pteronyssinus TaxID=6956 RepID=A0ABQ8JCJ9_DERPT|nr:hypothetical protein DERP_011256 [Dermatophagoides pteronyssinus]
MKNKLENFTRKNINRNLIIDKESTTTTKRQQQQTKRQQQQQMLYKPIHPKRKYSGKINADKLSGKAKKKKSSKLK